MPLEYTNVQIDMLNWQRQEKGIDLESELTR